MFKIAKSLVTVVAVLAIAAGATGAYFSDEVKIAGNSFATGTIAINVDGEHQWSQKYIFPDIKPGYVVHSNFIVTNEGNNPANITKVVSVPEGGNALLANALDYHLSVEVLEGSTVKWFTTLYDYDVTLASLLGSNMYLGMLPAGQNWSMKVTESYKMRDVGNEYQNITMPFDILVKAEQLKGTIVLENKEGADWDIIQDGTYGTLTYGVMDTKFNYNFSGVAPVPSTPYTLVIGTDPYFLGTALGSGITDGSGNINFSGSVDLGTAVNQKVWLILSSHWGGSSMTGWNQGSYLFETGLIDYYKS